jgi:hypothetical protein
MKVVIRLLAFLFFTLQMLACGGSDPTSAPISGGGGTGGSTGASGSNSPLEISVRTNYTLNLVKTEVVRCTLPAGTLPGTLAANATCTVQIPELDLYYSDLEFSVATNNVNTCAQIVFTPFQYRRSNSATFPIDGDGTTVDCSGTRPTEKYCYGGAAKNLELLADTYPENRSLYFLTANNLSKTFNLATSDTNRQTDKHLSQLENINVANNFTGSRITNVEDGVGGIVDYFAGTNGTFQDYRFACLNSFGETLYSWTLIIGDDDLLSTTSNVTFDTFYDWGN